MKNIEIYIASHKKFNVPMEDIYIPLRVGAINNDSFGYMGDDSGDNISAKNQSFCELTGLYWIWKNSKADVLGLVHYRRYFFENALSIRAIKILSREKIEEYLNKYDVLVPVRGFTIFGGNVRKQYLIKHNLEDLEVVEHIIQEKFPEYIDAYKKVFNGYYITQFNMLIANKKIVDDYCKWLFEILFLAEKELDKTFDKRDLYNKRVYGFLAERLFNVWLCRNNYLKIKELPVFNIENNLLKEKIFYLIKKIVIKCRL